MQILTAATLSILSLASTVLAGPVTLGKRVDVDCKPEPKNPGLNLPVEGQTLKFGVPTQLSYCTSYYFKENTVNLTVSIAKKDEPKSSQVLAKLKPKGWGYYSDIVVDGTDAGDYVLTTFEIATGYQTAYVNQTQSINIKLINDD